MTDPYLDRRTYLASIGAAGVAGIAGCMGSGTDTGTLATKVTDQPGDIVDFDASVVTIVGMWLGAGESSSEDDGVDENETAGDDETGTAEESNAERREYYEYDELQEADLVQLQGESTQLVDERELPVGEFQSLQLDTDGVDATLESGESAAVEVPGNAPLTFTEPFEIRSDTLTTFTADFMPVKRGRSGSYNLQPVPRGITVEYGTGNVDNGNQEES